MERDRLLLYFGMWFLTVVMGYIFLASWYKPAQDLSPFMIGAAGVLLGYYWGSAKAYKPGETEGITADKTKTTSTKETKSTLTEEIKPKEEEK